MFELFAGAANGLLANGLLAQVAGFIGQIMANGLANGL